MNGGVLEDLLASVPGAKGVWQGVFPRDKIPRRVNYPSAYVYVSALEVSSGIEYKINLGSVAISAVSSHSV